LQQNYKWSYNVAHRKVIQNIVGVYLIFDFDQYKK
jgi:hypothetical protein